MNGLQVSKTHLQEWAELLIQIFRLQYFMIYRSGVLHSGTLHSKNNGMKFRPKEYDLHPNEFHTYGMN